MLSRPMTLGKFEYPVGGLYSGHSLISLLHSSIRFREAAVWSHLLSARAALFLVLLTTAFGIAEELGTYPQVLEKERTIWRNSSIAKTGSCHIMNNHIHTTYFSRAWTQ